MNSHQTNIQSCLKISFRVSTFVLVSSCLLGCFSLPFTDSIAEEADNVTKIEQQIELFEEERNQEEVSELRSELETVKQSLDRVLLLESEIKDVLNSLDVMSFSDSTDNTLSSQDLVSLSNSKEEQREESVAMSSMEADKFSQLELQAASPIANNLKDGSQTLIRASENLPQRDVLLTKTGINKFSGLAESDDFKECSNIPVGEGYALHIASFKNKSSAETLLKKLTPEISLQSKCPKRAIIAEVFVKQQQFYSARVGAFQTKLEAQEACLQISRITQYCAVSEYSGELL